ncbi:hypothetical protein KCU88_g2344, partial [Aureobasidium melanogenum]
MGVRGVADLSKIYGPHNVQESVSDWLRSGCRDYYNSDKVDAASTNGRYPINGEVDRSSVASGDDTVSIVESIPESYSSGSSSRTSWMNSSDSVDVFSDEDDKEHVREPETSHGSRAPVEPQNHPHNGFQTSGQSTTSVGAAAHLGHNISTTIQAEGPDLAQTRSETNLAPRVADAAGGRHNRAALRRSSCSGNTQAAPPKLRRDTEVTDQFVCLLIIFATRLITAIWPLSACPPMMSTCFNGAGVLPLRVFIQETLRRSKTSYSTLQVALYYLILLKAKLPPQNPTISGECPVRAQCRAMQCGRRMFLSALMLASKYLQDRNYSARAWSKISGLRSSEINENEREYLSKIDYSLHVPKEHFDNWSQIVLALSRLSKEPPRGPTGPADFLSGRPGGAAGAMLMSMVCEVETGPIARETTFTDQWWTDVIQKLNPGLVKDPELVNDFLRQHVPADKIAQVLSPGLNKQPDRSWDALPSSPTQNTRVYDMNFSDTLKPRTAERCKAAITPQTPTQESPARNSVPPMQPQLRNLPTPQTTPQLTEKRPRSTTPDRPSLRCSASVDALRSMRRQCIMNANLERCPPPRPQDCRLQPVRSLTRPAETTREISSRSTTPSTSSPASVASDVTVCTSRSRSSSISSSSSWSSLASAIPRLRLASASCGESSSSLARVFSASDRRGLGVPETYCTQPDQGANSTAESSVIPSRFHDEGYGSGEEPRQKLAGQYLSTISEADAVRVLMSLSTQTETSSQSVTPTPERLTSYGETNCLRKENKPSRGHKRTLSKTDSGIPSQARSSLVCREVHLDVVEDPCQPYCDTTPKQWQLPTRDWATPRKALPKTTASKRVATYCSVQQFASAPDLASQYLKDSMIVAS